MPVSLKLSITEDVIEYLGNVRKRTTPKHMTYVNMQIVARVMHADIAGHFYDEGPNWTPLSPVYQKIKESSRVIKVKNSQPSQLGRYPTPWGNIGVRYGELFGSLGSVLRVSPTTVYYGTNAPHAAKFNFGGEVSRLKLRTKNGRGYYKDLDEPIEIPARPFMWVSEQAISSMRSALTDYFTAENSKREILIPPFGRSIIGNNGRRVRILYSR